MADFATGVIHAIHYHRLILDEAHNIKVNTGYAPQRYMAADIPKATDYECCTGVFCFESDVQMVPVGHASAESDWRVLLAFAILGGAAFCMLFLQVMQLPAAPLVSERAKEMQPLWAQVCETIPLVLSGTSAHWHTAALATSRYSIKKSSTLVGRPAQVAAIEANLG